jgi:hypothetical protein
MLLDSYLRYPATAFELCRGESAAA